MIVVSFAATIVAGAFLLSLPVSSSGHSLHMMDALFMATSAVCVTGLSVINIGSELSFFGQTVLMTLIQIGGLGIMTFSVFLMMVFRQKISLSSRLSVNFEPQHSESQNFIHVLIFVLMMTFSIEAAGAAALFARFREIEPFHEAVFSSVFHAVSAFCNAGFSLYPESLVRFQKETYVPVVFMGLIITGGLGFMLVDELRAWLLSMLRGQRMRLSLHTRICLIATAGLIGFGTLVIWLLEKDNLLQDLSGKYQFLNALFLSVTSRTAGFNTMETPSLTDGTLFFVGWLMFIGGCPGSTAGGIKLTTFVILIALVRNQIRGKSTSILKRKIPHVTVVRSLSIFAAGFLIINAAVLFFQVSENIGVSHLRTGGSFLDLLFEIISAFGTVGLSTGITETLSHSGKSLIILIMFLGRVGPITLGASFLTRKRPVSYEYVEEDVAIG